MRKTYITACAVLMTSVFGQNAALAAGTIDAGVKLYQAHDYAGAIAVWRPLAMQSDPNALFNLGQAYRQGRGVKVDPVQAAKYYEQAARLGHVAAQGNLATLLYFGTPPVKDTKRAIELYHVAARNGDARAQYMLGVLYFNGDDVGKDWPKAYAYTSLAKDAGLPEASDTSTRLAQFLKPDDMQLGQSIKATLVSAAQALPGTTPPVSAKPAPTVIIARVAKPAVAWTNASATSKAPVAAAILPVATPDVVPATLALNTVKSNNDGSPSVTSGNSALTELAAGSAAAAPSLPAAPTIITPHVDTAPAPHMTTLPTATKPKSVVAMSLSGNWHVQMGAYASQAAAEAQWKGQHIKITASLGTTDPIYVAAGSMTKLQVGNFASHDAAAKACSQMKTQGLNCFPVKS